MAILRTLLVAIVVLSLSPAARALQADELLLIINSRSPEGRELAEYYAKVREVPAGRIVALDLPLDDAITFEQYESAVAPAVRKYLADNQLKDKVKCLVTFYGMPLRIRDQAPTTQEGDTVAKLTDRQKKIMEQLEPAVKQVEALAIEAKKDFKPSEDKRRIEHLTDRYDAALKTLNEAMPSQPVEKRKEILEKLVPIFELLNGPAGLAERIGPQRLTDPNLSPEDRKKWTELLTAAKATAARLQELGTQFDKPEVREALHQIAEKQLGLIGQGQVIQQEITLLRHAGTGASIDSELALIWWDGKYPRGNWMPNTLCYAIRTQGPVAPPPTLMVCRLDAPEAAIVRRMIDTSIQVEKDGLKGKVVIDSRGLSPRGDAYGVFDERLRWLAKFLKEKTKLDVVHDDKAPVLPAESVEGVALYCGWYSLHKYVPLAKFNAGAVGYHIASSEMVSLHKPKEPGWVAGLLRDGVVASQGPVAEPYLHAFTVPEEFFPLLLTGKLTFAEVYWKTQRWTSWMVGAVGDPLYTPYKTNPAITPDDLPAPLRPILGLPATAPTTSATTVPTATGAQGG